MARDGSKGKQRGGLVKRGGVYYVRIRIDGREYFRSTGETDHRRAKATAERIRTEIREAAKAAAVADKASLEFLSALDIVDAENRGVTQIHAHRLSARWDVILRNCDPDTRAGDIGIDWLREYEGRRRGDGIRGQTIVRELQAIKRALLIAKRRGYIQDIPDPWPRVRRDPKDKAKSGKLRPPELIAAYLRELHQDARDEVEFALMTGLRLGEVKRVQGDWVEPNPGGEGYILRVPDWAAKTREGRIVGLPPRALEIVARRLRDDPPREFVFSQSEFKKTRERASRRAGADSTITLRDMRHTYATVALHGSGDPVATMRALGHKDLATTELYQSSTIQRTAAVGGHVAGYLDDTD